MSEQQEQFDIQKLFVRDLSFESPQAPVIFTEQWQPSRSEERRVGERV